MQGRKLFVQLLLVIPPRRGYVYLYICSVSLQLLNRFFITIYFDFFHFLYFQFLFFVSFLFFLSFSLFYFSG